MRRRRRTSCIKRASNEARPAGMRRPLVDACCCWTRAGTSQWCVADRRRPAPSSRWPDALPIGAAANGQASCQRIYDLPRPPLAQLTSTDADAADAAAICRMLDRIASSTTAATVSEPYWHFLKDRSSNLILSELQNDRATLRLCS